MAARKSTSKSRAGSPRHQRRAKPKAANRPANPPADQPGQSVRLQKLLAAAGFGSRRASEELIRQGRVSINAVVAKLGDSADPARDDVRLDGERLSKEKPVYWIVNKPEGVITSVRDPQGRRTILNLVPERGPRMFPVGRLDLSTSGLVLMTNDGAMTQRLLHPSLGNEREYRVTVRGAVEEKTLKRLRAGVALEDGRTSRCEVAKVRIDPKSGTTTFYLTLREGRKRQIRRAMQFLKHPVKKLVRVRMGPLRLGRLAVGDARPLRREEIRALETHVAGLTRQPRRASRRSPVRRG